MENFKVLTHPRFGRVRTVELENAPYFVGKDIAAILGYAKPDGFVRAHVDEEDKQRLAVPAFDFLSHRQGVVVNARGVESLLNAASSPSAPAIRDWLLGEEIPDETSEDAARGLGFVDEHFAKSGEKYSTVRWNRVNEYLKSFGFPHKVGEDDYLPENVFYRLAMKASNEAAKVFQAKIADEILPSIRKHGYYVSPASSPESKKMAFELHEAGQKLLDSTDRMIPCDSELAHELIAIAELMEPAPERNKILIHAANLLIGQRLF